MVYTGVIAFALLMFGLFQLFGLSLYNTASNEDIRHRWNGSQRNRASVRMYSNRVSTKEAIYHFLYSKLEESKLHKYVTLKQKYA